MPVISIKNFGGISPRTPARYLQPNQARVALNCPTFLGSLRALPEPSASIHTLTKTGAARTLFRYGDSDSPEDEHWFHWPGDIDVARSQIFADAFGWVFYSGDGGLKGTYEDIALSGSDFPTDSRPLGMPAPVAAPLAAAEDYTAASYAAEVLLTTTLVSACTDTYGISISTTTDEDAEYSNVTLTNPITAASIETAINAHAVAADVTATDNDDGTVTIVTDTTGPSTALFVRIQTGTEPDPGPFAFNANPNTSETGTATSDAEATITEHFRLNIGSSYTDGDSIKITTETSTVMDQDGYSAAPTASALASTINTAAGVKITATVDGEDIVLTAGTEGNAPDGFIRVEHTKWTEEWYEDNSWLDMEG